LRLHNDRSTFVKNEKVEKNNATVRFLNGSTKTSIAFLVVLSILFYVSFLFSAATIHKDEYYHYDVRIAPVVDVTVT